MAPSTTAPIPSADRDRGSDPLDDPAGRRSRARTGWAALGAAVAVALVHLAPAAALGPGALDADLGIQYFLGGETARGAVPLVDFEHTWNVGSWWFNAALHRLAGGDPSVWLYLWGRVLGPALAAVTAVGVLWRLRLRAEWILIGAGTWLALSHVIHSKYAIPVLWAFVLVPTGRERDGAAGLRRDVVARALLAGLTVLSQVELAVLLGAGVVLFDLIGDGHGDDGAAGPRPWRGRLVRAAAVPLGAAAALGVELVAYAAIGQPPGEIIRQLLGNPAETAEGFTYGYPLLSAPSLRPKLLPASLLLAFVPAVWLRLAPATRLVACLHLAQALIAIRRPDPAHVDAATTLLGLLVALVLHDLMTDVRGRGRLRWALAALPSAALAVAGGAVALAAVIGGFRVESLVAIAIPAVLLAALVWAVRRAPAAEAALSLGAAAVAVGLLLAGVGGGVAAALRQDAALGPTQALASALADPIERCTGGDRVAWVVPGPLPLYTALGIENPTPYTVFWYGFQAEHERVRRALAAGDIPAIVQVGEGWPASFGGLPADIARALAVCDARPADGDVPATTIWVAD
jgi:hypothetical protein